MRRYLDLLRGGGAEAFAEIPSGEKSERSEESHATVSQARATETATTVISHNSLISQFRISAHDDELVRKSQSGDFVGEMFHTPEYETAKKAKEAKKEVASPGEGGSTKDIVAGFDQWGDEQAERAAIIEHDAGVPQSWAEGFARLHPDRPPGHVPPKRWRQFVDDVGRFLDYGWAQKAASLGWSPLELFGCDRNKPFARVDQAGLLWLVHGRKLLALTADSAVIETQAGSRLTYRRKPEGGNGAVLVWERAR